MQSKMCTFTRRRVTRKGCKETISPVEDCGDVVSVLGTEVLVVAAGCDDPTGGVLVTHPEVREPGLDTARRGHSVQAMCNIYTTPGLYILPSAALEG